MNQNISGQLDEEFLGFWYEGQKESEVSNEEKLEKMKPLKRNAHLNEISWS